MIATALWLLVAVALVITIIDYPLVVVFIVAWAVFLAGVSAIFWRDRD